MYGVNVDVYTIHKSLKYVFTKKELNVQQGRWLELLKDYDISVIYYLGMDNLVEDALTRITMGSVYHVEDGKKYLVKDVNMVGKLGARYEDPSTGGFILHNN